MNKQEIKELKQAHSKVKKEFNDWEKQIKGKEAVEQIYFMGRLSALMDVTGIVLDSPAYEILSKISELALKTSEKMKN